MTSTTQTTEVDKQVHWHTLSTVNMSIQALFTL